MGGDPETLVGETDTLVVDAVLKHCVSETLLLLFVGLKPHSSMQGLLLVLSSGNTWQLRGPHGVQGIESGSAA